jgi:hypothetical protein
MHPLNNYFIIAGYDEVYRTTTGGAFWDSISNNLTTKTAIRTIALAPSDIDVIYVATYSKLSVTFDGGNSWTNISGSNLPNLPVNCIVYQDLTNDDLYIGTDVGVYHRDNTMSDWQAFMSGFPNVIVDELEIHYGSGKIRAATFGRGIWESNLQSQPNGIANNYMSYVSTYPNPAVDYFILNVPENVISKNPVLNIYNLTGQLVLSKNIKSANQFVDVSNLKSGYYIYELGAVGIRNVRSKLIVLPN